MTESRAGGLAMDIKTQLARQGLLSRWVTNEDNVLLFETGGHYLRVAVSDADEGTVQLDVDSE